MKNSHICAIDEKKNKLRNCLDTFKLTLNVKRIHYIDSCTPAMVYTYLRDQDASSVAIVCKDKSCLKLKDFWWRKNPSDEGK